MALRIYFGGGRAALPNVKNELVEEPTRGRARFSTLRSAGYSSSSLVPGDRNGIVVPDLWGMGSVREHLLHAVPDT
jgi:hypothetical protein